MAVTVLIGCCGWSYLNEREFAGQIKRKYSAKLQAYVQLFNTVEINSTFYRLPRLSTAQKWRQEADVLNPKFEFTVKAYQGITHRHRFPGGSVSLFNQVKEICGALRTSIILFQSPASFRPTDASVKAMKSFFSKIDRDNLTCVWEPRGQWYDNPALIAETCEGAGLSTASILFATSRSSLGKRRLPTSVCTALGSRAYMSTIFPRMSSAVWPPF